ncbi:hypothetical protein D3C85_687830 [compost metagenome]
MHPAQRGLFSTADLTDLLQLRVAESIGGVAQASHQCRAFPLARVLRFADPGAMAVVPQVRGIRVGALWMLNAVLSGYRVCLHGEQLIVQLKNLLPLMLVNPLCIGLGVCWQGQVRLLIGAEIRVPQACPAIGRLHRLEPFEERREFRPRDIADRACGGECTQLDDALQHADGLLTGLGQATFSQIDNALDHFIGELISGVRQHQFTHARHQRRDHQQRGVEDVREHFFQVIPPGPAGHAVGVLGGNRDVPCVVEHLVDFLPVEVTP